MTATLLVDIGLLATQDDSLGEIRDAAIVLSGDSIAWVGPVASAPDADERVGVGGKTVLPGFVDSHAHLAFVGDRSEEFVARMRGMPYAAGGIRVTVANTRGAPDALLRLNVERLAAELLHAGCSTRARRWRWPPTATPDRPTRRRCRSRSRWQCARWR